MNIVTSSDPNDIIPLNENGSYQWWYFDGIADIGEYSFVVILFSSFPFSPQYLRKLISGEAKLNPLDFAAVNFNLYKAGKITNYFLNEFFSDKIIITKKNDKVDTLKIGSSSINFSKDEISLKIKGVEKWKKRVINSEFDFKINTSIQTLSTLESAGKNINHYWSPAGINNSFEAKIKIRRNEDQFAPRKKLQFKGTGYYDRNWGCEPMYENILDWKWGRFHKDDMTIVFFDITYKENYSPPFRKVIITKGNELLLETSSPETNYIYSKNYWRLEFPKVIKIKTDNVEIEVLNKQKSDNGPFYIRFQSEYKISINGEKFNGMGFSEVIKPQNLKRTWLYPFINMKIGKA